MNDNFKNSIITIVSQVWYVPLALLASAYYQGDKNWKIYLIFTLLSLAAAILLSWIFFGPKKFFIKFLSIVKNNFVNIVFILVFLTGLYFLVFNVVNFIVSKLLLFLSSSISLAYFLGKLKKFSNINLLKSFFKEDLSVMNNWIATETQEDQGTDFRSIPLNGEPLKKVVFNVSPETPFWRAGIKIVDPNGSILPLRSDKSILFHLGSTDRENYFGITAYRNGTWVKLVNKIVKYDPNKPVSIKFEVNENNFIKFYVNEEVEYEPEERINPRLLKKAYIVGWGDEHNFRVRFDSIGFLTRKTDGVQRETVFPASEVTYPEVLVSMYSFTYNNGSLEVLFENSDKQSVLIKEISVEGEKLNTEEFSIGGRKQVKKNLNVANKKVLEVERITPEMRVRYKKLDSETIYTAVAKIRRKKRADGFYNIEKIENSAIVRE